MADSPSTSSSAERRRAWQRRTPALVLAAGVGLALLLWTLLPGPALRMVLREGGPVEGGTALLWWLLAAAAALAPDRGLDARLRFALPVACAAFGARELDWHRRFAGESVLKLSYYLDPGPAAAKLLAGGCVLLALASLATLVVCGARTVARDWRRGEPYAHAIAWVLLGLVITKALDRSVNVLAQDVGVALPAATALLVSALEEMGELAVALVAGLALVLHRRRAGA